MLKLIKNTVVLAILSIVVVFPFPIIFSLFLNEVRIKKIRHAVQSLSFLPYFISSAIMVSILYTLVSPSYGLVNKIIEFFGGEAIFFMAKHRITAAFSHCHQGFEHLLPGLSQQVRHRRSVCKLPAADQGGHFPENIG